MHTPSIHPSMHSSHHVEQMEVVQAGEKQAVVWCQFCAMKCPVEMCQLWFLVFYWLQLVRLEILSTFNPHSGWSHMRAAWVRSSVRPSCVCYFSFFCSFSQVNPLPDNAFPLFSVHGLVLQSSPRLILYKSLNSRSVHLHFWHQAFYLKGSKCWWACGMHGVYLKWYI